MSFHVGLKRGYDESLVLESFKSYHELDKMIANFNSENEFLNSINRKDFNEVLITNQNSNFNAISSTARRLIPIFENGDEDSLIDSMVSSTFSEPTKEFDIYIFKEYLMEEKLKFTKVDNNFGKNKLSQIDTLLNILNYNEYNDNSKLEFKTKLNELLGDRSYSKIRSLYMTLNDFGFLYDESLNKVYNENKYEVNLEERNYYIETYNRKIDSYFNKKNQMSFEDFTEKVYSEIRNNHRDELPGDNSFPPSKKLNLRG